MFKDSPEGQTHYENDGCGIVEHNKPLNQQEKKETSVDSMLDAVFYCQHCGGKKEHSFISKILVWFLLKMGMSKGEIINKLIQKRHEYH